jgi:FkbM family methyltransferase
VNLQVYDAYWESLLGAVGLVGRGTNGRMVELFKHLCEVIQCRMTVEVGAHGAEFSRDMARRLPQATIVAFEANPHVHSAFAGRVGGRVDYRQSLVASDRRPRTLYIPRRSQWADKDVEHHPGATIASLKKGVAVVEAEEVVVESTTLDQVCADTEWLAPCGLWIDVEGAASEVLIGAHASLSRNVQLIFMEVERRAAWHDQWLLADVRDYLGMKGFVPVCRDRETEWQFNEVYVQSEAISPKVVTALGQYIGQLVAAP